MAIEDMVTKKIVLLSRQPSSVAVAPFSGGKYLVPWTVARVAIAKNQSCIESKPLLPKSSGTGAAVMPVAWMLVQLLRTNLVRTIRCVEAISENTSTRQGRLRHAYRQIF
jgi:hypothetical protein